MGTRTLTSTDVERLVEWEGLLAALERVHRELATGRAVQPAPVPLRDPSAQAADSPAVVPMLSFAPDLGLFAVKVLADAPRNRELGRPAQRSTVSLYAADTGECLAMVDGRALTRIRTAAATTMATRALARPDSRTVALLGSGALAMEHAAALDRAFELDEIRVWSRSADRARRATDGLRALGLPAVAAASAADAVRKADIVCTLTPSLSPFLSAGMLAPGVHVNAVGSPPRRAYSELEPSVFARAAVVAVDSRPVAWADSGNVRNAVASGAVAEADIVEIGEVLEGLVPGRTSPEHTTIFNSVGIGLQDLAAADHILRRAAAAGAGTMVTIRE